MNTTVGVSNTATSPAPGALTFLSVASAPDVAFPAGTVVPGFGLSAPGAPGELLLSLSAGFFRTVGPISWGGGDAPPAGFTLTLPLVPSLVGAQLFLQGSLLDISAQPFLGVTNGLAVTLAAPDLPGLVLIQPGTFQMGSPEPYFVWPYFNGFDSKPVHEVTITTEFHYGPSLFCDQARIELSYHSGTECGAPPGTAPVGQYAPNAWGLYDMHGNVWEFCLDSWASYTATPKVDPFVTGTAGKGMRGGGWNSHSGFSRSASWYELGNEFAYPTLGFRVVLATVLVP